MLALKAALLVMCVQLTWSPYQVGSDVLHQDLWLHIDDMLCIRVLKMISQILCDTSSDRQKTQYPVYSVAMDPILLSLPILEHRLYKSVTDMINSQWANTPPRNIRIVVVNTEVLMSCISIRVLCIHFNVGVEGISAQPVIDQDRTRYIKACIEDVLIWLDLHVWIAYRWIHMFES